MYVLIYIYEYVNIFGDLNWWLWRFLARLQKLHPSTQRLNASKSLSWWEHFRHHEIATRSFPLWTWISPDESHVRTLGDVGYLPCGTMLGMNGEDLYRRTKDSQWTTYFLLTAIMGEGYPQRILQNLLSHIYIPLNSKELKSASGFSQVFSDSCWIKITLKPRVERLKVQGGHFKIAWMINYQPQLITPPQV